MPGSHEFTIKYEVDRGNAEYTDAEKSRNERFTFQDIEKKYTTGSDGTKVITNDFFVAAAGGNSYELKAWDTNTNTVTSSGKIIINRFFNYIEIKMKGLSSVASSLNVFENEFKDNYFHLKALTSVEMEHMENISTGDTNSFKIKVREAYRKSEAKDKEPFVVIVAYTDHLAVKNPNQSLIKNGVNVGPGCAPIEIPIIGAGLTNPAMKRRSLWNNLESGQDWFVSCSFLPDGEGENIDITKTKCEAITVSSSSPNNCKKVKINVDHLNEATGKITLTVNWVDRMRAGIAFGGNLICVCTRSWWNDISEIEQNQIIIHEMGHKVGMVANGMRKLPDKVSSHYDNSKGHVGNHCYFENADGQARYDSTTDRANSKCVMYGSVNGRSKFCEKCKPALRKLDISDGWSAF